MPGSMECLIVSQSERCYTSQLDVTVVAIAPPQAKRASTFRLQLAVIRLKPRDAGNDSVERVRTQGDFVDIGEPVELRG